MKLAIITPTCRTNPRFAEMARTLFFSFRRAPASTELQWIVVDDRLWWTQVHDRQEEIGGELARIPGEVAARITGAHFAPPPTAYRGPDVSDPLPAHNTARNAGLEALDPDVGYVIFLSDCSVVTKDWVSVAVDIAGQGLGWKCRFKGMFDHVIPRDEPLTYQDCWDNLHPVKAETVAGPCWGVPKEALTAVGGFDADYDGEDDLYDHEILVRLQRAGVSFVTTKRAGVVRMDRTRLKTEVTTKQGALRANRNRAYYQQLIQDKDRILPGAGRLAGLAVPRRSVAPPPPLAPARPLAWQAAPARARGRDDATPAPAGTAADQMINVRDPDMTFSSDPDPAATKTSIWATPDGKPTMLQWAGQLAGVPDPRKPLLAFPNNATLNDPELRRRANEVHMPATPTPRPLTLHERALAAKAQKASAAAAEASGTAGPVAEEARCIYVPTQGGHKGKRCRLKKAHGGPHLYEGEPVFGASVAQKSPSDSVTAPNHPSPSAPAPVSNEPPQPSPAVAAVRARMDEHIMAVDELLADLANSLAKQVVLLAVALRREGVLANEETFRVMVSGVVRKPLDPETRTQSEIGEQITAVMAEISKICIELPAIPATPEEFKSLSTYTRIMDGWRKMTGLPTRTSMPPFDRGYQAAADIGLSIEPPDDLRALDDELANLERAVAAGEDEDDIVSVEPLTEAQADAQAKAAKMREEIEILTQQILNDGEPTDAELDEAVADVAADLLEEEVIAGTPDVPPSGSN